MRPALSILVPAYNAERFVRSAMESISRQTFGDFEVIIVNDGSTDGTLNVLRRHADSDGRFKIISRANQGLTRSLNEALAASQGDIIGRMDADDIALPTRLASQMRFLADHPKVVAAGTAALITDPGGLPIVKAFTYTSHDDIDRVHLEKATSAIAHPSAVVRRSALDRVGGYRPELEPAEDLDLWLRWPKSANSPTSRKFTFDTGFTCPA